MVTERIQKKLVLPEKEFEKFKFAIICMNQANFIRDDECAMNLADFKTQSTQRKCVY